MLAATASDRSTWVGVFDHECSQSSGINPSALIARQPVIPSHLMFLVFEKWATALARLCERNFRRLALNLVLKSSRSGTDTHAVV